MTSTSLLLGHSSAGCFSSCQVSPLVSATTVGFVWYSGSGRDLLPPRVPCCVYWYLAILLLSTAKLPGSVVLAMLLFLVKPWVPTVRFCLLHPRHCEHEFCIYGSKYYKNFFSKISKKQNLNLPHTSWQLYIYIAFPLSWVLEVMERRFK